MQQHELISKTLCWATKEDTLCNLLIQNPEKDKANLLYREQMGGAGGGWWGLTAKGHEGNVLYCIVTMFIQKFKHPFAKALQTVPFK